MAGRQTYDASPKEQRILEHRAARRTVLRHEYLKQIGNPHRMVTGEGGAGGGIMFDLGLNRFQSMRATALEHFRPNPRTGLFGLWAVVLPIGLALYLVIPAKDRQEQKYRTGQVSYRDREFKFT